VLLWELDLGKKQFFDYAAQLAVKHKIKFRHGRPSQKWWRLLKNRHERMCLRRPEPTAAVRHMCMNRSKVGKYFEALKSLLMKTGLVDKPQQVWNMDETGVQLEHKPRRVLAQKGSKFLHARTSGNRETLTVIACVNGAGESIPPHIIAKGKTSKSLHGFDMQSAPEGSTWSVSSSGWTKQGIAKLWFEKSFLPNIGKERPQVLILDGHDSHNFVELISLAMENEIQIIELPAHTSHWLQPCDRTLFKPLKDAYNDACQEMMNAYPGTTVSHSNFCSLFTKAWKKAVTPENIKSGFQACGIYPLDSSRIPEEAYLPNTLYTTTEPLMQDVTVVEPNGQTDTVQPGVEANDTVMLENDQVTSRSTDLVSDVAHATSDADVSLITNIDTSQLLQTEEIDISNITISFDHDQVAAEPDQPAANATVDTSERPCPPDLALHAIELAIRADKLDQYKQAYDRKMPFLNDPIYMTWKTFKDRCSVQETAALDNRADASFSSSGPTNSTPVTSVQVPENAMEKQALSLDLISCDQTPVQGDSTPQSTVRILQTVSVNTMPEVDSDSDILVIPKPHARKKSARNLTEKFFILTSEEAYAAKVKQKEEKEKAEAEKKIRQEKRKKLKLEKENPPAAVKGSKTSGNKTKSKKDRTKCMYCEIQYCDSSVAWVMCTNCKQWACTDCAHLSRKNKSFICDSCK